MLCRECVDRTKQIAAMEAEIAQCAVTSPNARP